VKVRVKVRVKGSDRVRKKVRDRARVRVRDGVKVRDRDGVKVRYRDRVRAPSSIVTTPFNRAVPLLEASTPRVLTSWSPNPLE
jgi:hypothetical protein